MIIMPLTLAQISRFLTETVIEEAFRRRTGSKESIRSIELTRAAPAGEGLLSSVYRITVTGIQHTTSFVIKSFVSDALLRKTLTSDIYFQREVEFFSKMLPVLVSVQKSMGAKQDIRHDVPILYSYHCDGVNDFILMEDMAESKYTSVPQYPNTTEIDAILRTLAHLHAVSMTLRIKRPEQFYKFANTLPEVYYTKRNHAWYGKFLQNAIEIDKKALAVYEDPSTSVYFKKFIQLTSVDVYKVMMELISNKSKHQVVCHGDAWFPNFLYSSERAVMIDFQLFRFASPIIDISYFLIMCTHILRTKDDFLQALKMYHDFLRFYLIDMGMDTNEIISWEDIKNELLKYGKFGVIAALTTVPILCSERCDVSQSFEMKFSRTDRIPLEELWKLTPLETEEHRMMLVNVIRVAVDIGLI